MRSWRSSHAGAWLCDQHVPAFGSKEIGDIPARRRAFWSRGRITGAQNLIVFGDFDEARLLEIVSKAKKVVIYGLEEDRDLANAAAKAIVQGFQKVHYFDAGFNGWKREGHPVEKNN